MAHSVRSPPTRWNRRLTSSSCVDAETTWGRRQGARGIIADVGPGITAEGTLGTWISPPRLLIGSDEYTAVP